MKQQLQHAIKPQQGFTILELIVVVSIIGLITSLATDYMMNQGNHERYKTTQERLKQIQYALIGDSSRTINNQPAFSGYLFDTGIKPKYLRDLLSNGYCTDATKIDQAACQASQAEWRQANNWKGPYLQATAYQDVQIDENTLITIPVFRDGWANRNAEQDHLNFGWNFDANFENRAIKIASYGLNGAALQDDKKSADYLYEKDMMSLIEFNQIKGANLTLSIINNTKQDNARYCIKARYADGSEEFVELQNKATIPAAKVFGYVELAVLKKQSNNASCQIAEPLNGFEKTGLYSHNLFSASSPISLAIN